VACADGGGQSILMSRAPSEAASSAPIMHIMSTHREPTGLLRPIPTSSAGTTTPQSAAGNERLRSPLATRPAVRCVTRPPHGSPIVGEPAGTRGTVGPLLGRIRRDARRIPDGSPTGPDGAAAGLARITSL
jgi:hypothetical protein